MDKFTELYNYLKEEGLTDLSAEEFKAEYAAGTAKNTELYSYLKSEKLTDLDAEKFNLEYFPGVEKKNPNDISPSNTPEVITDSTTETPEVVDTSLDTSTIEKPLGDNTVIDVQEEDSTVTEFPAYDPREQGKEINANPITYNSSDSQFDKSLAFITKDLIDREESEVVNRMKYHFEDYGFDFEQGGGFMSGLDGMKVTSKDDPTKSININLDPVFGDIFGGESGPAKELRKFLKENRRTDQRMESLDASYDKNRKKYFSSEATKKDIQAVRNSAKNLNSDYKVYQDRKTIHEAEIDALLGQPKEIQNTPEWKIKYQQTLAAGKRLKQFKNRLTDNYNSYKKFEGQINSSVGNYIDMKEADDSTFFGGLVNDIVGPGVSEVLAALWGTGVDGFYKAAQFFDEDFGMTAEEKKDRYIDIAKDLGYPVPENIEDDAVYTKWLEGLQEQKFEDKEVEGELSFKPFPKEIMERLEADGFDLSKPTLNGQYFNKNQSGLNKFLNGQYIDLPDYAYDKTRGERLKRLVLDQEVKENKNPQKELVKKYWNEIVSADDISDEKYAKQSNSNIVYTGLSGLAKSLPSVLTSFASRGKIAPAVGLGAAKRNLIAKGLGLTTKGGIAQTVSFAMLQAEAMNVEMNNDPDFKYVTESERKNIVIPTAITVGILERYGFMNIARNKAIMTGLMNKVTNMLPAGATAAMFKNQMNKLVQSNIAKGIFSNTAVKAAATFTGRVTKATLTEAETGGLQQIAEMGYKDVWNNMNNKDMFDQPELWTKEFWGTVGHAAAAEAVGGFVMGVPGAVIAAAKNKTSDLLSDDLVEMFDMIRNDEITVEAYQTQLDLAVSNGKITSEQASKQMLDFQTLSGAANTLPSDLDINSRKKGLVLIFEQQQLEAEMEKMNKNLNSYKTKEARVEEIKNEIGQLGTNQAQANTNLRNETEGIQDSVLVTEEDATKSLQDKGVQNPTVEQIKTEQDALQKQSTTSLDAQESSRSSEEVGQRIPDSQSTQQSETEDKTQDKKKTKEEVSQEEQNDIDDFFGDEVLDDVETSSDNLSINRKQVEGDTEIENTTLASAVVNKAKKAARAIAKIAPEVKIVLHDTQAEYEKYATKGSRGYYNPNSKVIHINLTKAKGNTVAHEVFHAVFLDKISGGDVQAKQAALKLITSVRKTLPAESLLAKRIDNFAKNYDENFKNEEKLAELFSLMATEYKTLKKPGQNKIIEFIRSMAAKLGVTIPGGFGKTDESVIDFMNAFSKKVRTGTEITEGDVDVLNKIDKELDVEQEQGESGQVGTFTFKGRESKAPDINTDTRSYAKNIIQKDLQDYNGQNFVTNMYDFTNAGPTDIGAGIVLDLYGGKNYVADMMEKTGAKLGEVSNVAAFNTKGQAEGFIKNAIDGNANLFAPHVGTKEGSWQFQQNIFEQLTEKLLDNNILTNQELIESFNDGLKSKNGQSALNIFNKKYKKNLTNLNEFKDNPKRLVELLDIDNNYSPDLRKILNDKIASNKKVQAALGVKNKIQFAELLEDPMNVGSQKFDIIGLVEFDNTTFKTPSRPKKGDADYHPSFAWTVKAKIKAIVQPTNFYQSTEVTDSYTKFNKSGAVVSTRENTKDFKSSNVSSSAGSGPKVATVKSEIRQGREQSTEQQVKDQTGMPASGFYSAQAMVSDIQRQFNRIGPGYVAKRAKQGAYGGGGGVYVIGPNKRIVKNPTRKGRQQAMDNENDLLRIIIAGREEGGFEDAAIKDYLKRRKRKVDGKTASAYSAKEINAAFKVLESEAFDSYMFREYPTSFNDIKGGFLAGLKLMKDVDTYYKKLVEKNNLIKDRNAKNRKTKQVPLTDEQINLKVLDYFMSLPGYKSVGVKGKRQTSQQLAMERDMLNILLPDPLKANPKRIAAINRRIKNIKFTERNLKGVQRALRNYIRTVLPRDLYTKKEITDLIDKVNRVNATNFKSVKDEVFKIVTTKTNKRLESVLFKMLDKSYTTIQSGRFKGVKIDNETRKKLNRINKLVVNPKSTGNQIMEANEKLLKLYKQVSTEEIVDEKDKKSRKTKSTFSKSDLQQMAEITLAMQINTSFTQDMNDSNKTTQLSSVINSLKQIEESGKANFEYELLQDAIQYRENERAVYKDMTGIDIDAKQSLIDQGIPENEITEFMVNEEFQKIKKDVSLDAKESGGLKVEGVIKRFKGSLNSLATKIEQGLFGSAEDMMGLIDRISTQPGEIFEGATQELTQKKIRSSSRVYKSRMIGQQLSLSNKMTELFGNKWVNINRKNSQPTESIVRSKIKDDLLQGQLKEAQENKTLKKGERTALINSIQKEINSNTINISQNQLLYYYSQMQDPSLEGSMITTFDATRKGNITFDNEFKSRIEQEISDKLDDRLKDLSEWMIKDYYPTSYDHYNNTYKKIYRTDMPWNQNYAGRVYRQNENDMEALDLLADSQSWITNVGSASTKVRMQNTNAIEKTDGIDALLNYTKDMEYFAAYGVAIRDINKIFSSPMIKETIKEKFGSTIYTYIDDSIKKIANKGIQSQRQIQIINTFNNTFLLSRLGLNPTLILKQMTSFITYGNDIGYINWVKNAAMSTTQAKKLVNEVLDNSIVLQDRYGQTIKRAVETYADEKFEKMNGGLLERFGLTNAKQDKISKILMWTTMTGDKGAILVGGVPNYLYYKNEFKKKNPEASEQEVIDHAIKKFEADTLRTQQSSDLQDKDYFQTKGALIRAFNMFLTTPKQYFRREIIAARNMYRIIKSGGKQGKGVVRDNGELNYWRSLGKSARSFGVYHVVMPVVFQWVSAGLPGLLRGMNDEDKEDLGLALVLGNLNALFIIGKVAETLKDVMLDKPWAKTPSTIPILGQTAQLANLYMRAQKAKGKKREEAMNKFMAEAIALTGIPAPQLRKFMKNFSEIGDSKSMGEFILKLFNFSEYQQKGGKKSKGFKLTKAEKKRYFPELYPDTKEDGPMEDFLKLQKEAKAEEKRLRKELLDQIYK
ncbi:MAG: hypothetical protein CMJ25_02995 [Phycisphaerae bacterium]|nr:hypothetical protein [Phycisphaerae bacterium]